MDYGRERRGAGHDLHGRLGWRRSDLLGGGFRGMMVALFAIVAMGALFVSGVSQAQAQQAQLEAQSEPEPGQRQEQRQEQTNPAGYEPLLSQPEAEETASSVAGEIADGRDESTEPVDGGGDVGSETDTDGAAEEGSKSEPPDISAEAGTEADRVADEADQRIDQQTAALSESRLGQAPDEIEAAGEEVQEVQDEAAGEQLPEASPGPPLAESTESTAPESTAVEPSPATGATQGAEVADERTEPDTGASPGSRYPPRTAATTAYDSNDSRGEPATPAGTPDSGGVPLPAFVIVALALGAGLVGAALVMRSSVGPVGPTDDE